MARPQLQQPETLAERQARQRARAAEIRDLYEANPELAKLDNEGDPDAEVE
jgi:hypothetical protein